MGTLAVPVTCIRLIGDFGRNLSCGSPTTGLPLEMGVGFRMFKSGSDFLLGDEISDVRTVAGVIPRDEPPHVFCAPRGFAI